MQRARIRRRIRQRAADVMLHFQCDDVRPQRQHLAGGGDLEKSGGCRLELRLQRGKLGRVIHVGRSSVTGVRQIARGLKFHLGYDDDAIALHSGDGGDLKRIVRPGGGSEQ